TPVSLIRATKGSAFGIRQLFEKSWAKTFGFVAYLNKIFFTYPTAWIKQNTKKWRRQLAAKGLNKTFSLGCRIHVNKQREFDGLFWYSLICLYFLGIKILLWYFFYYTIGGLFFSIVRFYRTCAFTTSIIFFTSSSVSHI
ncbi:MAG: hypothetical protein ACI4JM_06175, partial [Oscillospiraceae bacterium]